jgi:2'-5' RNA ligase
MTSSSGSSSNSESPQRLFIALTLPAAVREILATLPQKTAGVSWSRPEQWHLTLRFLGDVPASQIERLLERLATVHVEPFVLPVEGVGTFPPNRPPRVVWIGTGSGHPRLFQLRQRIDDAVLAAGIDLDVRSFHPHVTLARCNEEVGPGLSPWLHRHREFTAPPFRVESFELYRSELHPGGAVHTELATYPLRRNP